MAVDLHGVSTVILPGTGSDDDYVRRAFAAALGDVGAVLCAPPPHPAALIAGYWAALDDAARTARIAVGGVSIGAAVAAAWALANPGRTVAVLAALPAWTGSPGDAPAAVAASQSAAMLHHHGLAGAIEQMRTSSPPWLADELTRSWRGQWPDLPAAMEQASRYIAPTAAELGRLRTPMGVAAAVDDPVHPVAVARHWVGSVPRAAICTVTLDQMGADPAALGAACVRALRAV